MFNKIRCEFRCCDKKFLLLGAAICIFLGAISAVLGGSSLLYNYLKLPRSAPSRLCFVLLWTVAYAIIGAVAGMIFQKKETSCCVYKYKSLLMFAVMMCFNLVWYPMFFAANAFFLCLVDSLIIAASSLFLALFVRRVSLLAFIGSVLFFIWVLYCFALNFVIFIMN